MVHPFFVILSAAKDLKRECRILRGGVCFPSRRCECLSAEGMLYLCGEKMFCHCPFLKMAPVTILFRRFHFFSSFYSLSHVIHYLTKILLTHPDECLFHPDFTDLHRGPHRKLACKGCYLCFENMFCNMFYFFFAM